MDDSPALAQQTEEEASADRSDAQQAVEEVQELHEEGDTFDSRISPLLDATQLEFTRKIRSASTLTQLRCKAPKTEQIPVSFIYLILFLIVSFVSGNTG